MLRLQTTWHADGSSMASKGDWRPASCITVVPSCRKWRNYRTTAKSVSMTSKGWSSRISFPKRVLMLWISWKSSLSTHRNNALVLNRCDWLQCSRSPDVLLVFYSKALLHFYFYTAPLPCHHTDLPIPARRKNRHVYEFDIKRSIADSIVDHDKILPMNSN